MKKAPMFRLTLLEAGIVCLMALVGVSLIVEDRRMKHVDDFGPLLSVQPQFERLDDAVKKEWIAQGNSSKEQLRTKLLDATVECIEKRLRAAHVRNTGVQKTPEGRIDIVLSKGADAAGVKNLVLRRGVLSFHEVTTRDDTLEVLKAVDSNPKFQGRLLPLISGENPYGLPLVDGKDCESAKAVVDEVDNTPGVLPSGKTLALARDLLRSSGRPLYLMDTQSRMEGVKVRYAAVIPENDDPHTGMVLFEMSDSDAERFGDLTQSLLGKGLAIVVDGEVQSVPDHQEPRCTRMEIAAGYTASEAFDLAAVLTSGPLPAPLVEVVPKEAGMQHPPAPPSKGELQ